MKKLLTIFACLLLSFTMCFSFVSCGGDEEDTEGPGFVNKVTLAAKLKVLSNKVDKMTTMEGLLAFEAAIDEVLASYEVVEDTTGSLTENEMPSETETDTNDVSTGTEAPVATDSIETTPVETVPSETTPVETDPIETTPAETTGTDAPVETDPIVTDPVETTPVETVPSETTPAETTGTDAPVVTDTETETAVSVPTETETQAPTETETGTTAETNNGELKVHNFDLLSDVVENENETTVEVDPIKVKKEELKAKVDKVKASVDSDYLGDVIANIVVIEKIEDATLKAVIFRVILELNTEEAFAEFVTYVEALVAHEVANVKDYTAPEYKWDNSYSVGYRVDYCIKRVLTFKTTESTESVINYFGTPSVEPEVEVSTEL